MSKVALRKPITVPDFYMPTVKALKKMGYTLISVGKLTSRGPDLVVISPDRMVFRVEVKKARKQKRGYSIHPVEAARSGDELIAIQFPSGYVLIEPMKHHLMSCAKLGSRNFFGLY